MSRMLFVFIFFILSTTSFSQTALKGQVDGELYLKFKDEVPIFWDTEIDTITISQFPYLKGIQNDFGIYRIENSFGFAKSARIRRILKIKFSDISKVNELISKLSLNPEIEYAESININYIHIVPNDPSYSTQWHLTKINADQAWNITTGSSSIDVAVVDDAIQTTHSELSCNIASTWDITNNTGSAMPPTSSYAHGTHVAGIVAACTNNNVGVSSIGWNTDIIAVKAANGSLVPNGQVGISHGYQGILWAAQNGAEIINCSWGVNQSQGGAYAQWEQDIINDAWNIYGCIIVAAAGNDNSSLPSYPAAYNHVIAVANSTQTDSRSSDSNYGTWVDVTAPGTNIYSTAVNNGYATFSGTSMASPLVAGLLALVWSANPSASRQDVIDCVLNTAVSLTWQGGSGRIDAYAAVSCMNSGSSAPTNDNCATAQSLTVQGQVCGVPTSGTIQNATASSISYPASCNGFATSSALDVWYIFTATSTEHDITVDPDGSIIGNNAYLDAQIALYNGNPCTNGIGTFIGCYDEPCSPNGGGCTTVYQATGLIPGNTYYVRVYDFGTAAVQPSNAGFTICITTPNGGGGSGHDFYIDNLVLSATSFVPGDPITIDCEQWTSDPNGTAVTVYMEYRLEDMNGNIITVLGSDNSGIGGGDAFDGESISTTIPTGIASGNYQICVIANTNGVAESNYNNNTQCQSITVSSSGGGNGHDFYPNNTTINNTSFAPNDLIELITETTTSTPNGSAAVIESIAELYDNNGNFVMQIDIAQGCNIGNGDPFDTQYFMDYIPNLPTGNYTACVNVNYNNAISESNTSNNTQCFSIYINNPTSNNYTVNTTSNPSNGGTTTGGGVYSFGSAVTISAFASTGWAFDRWSENGNVISYATSQTFNVTSNRNFIAEFVPSAQLANLTNLYDNSYVSGNQVIFDFAIQNTGNVGAGTFDVYYLASDGWNSYIIGTPTTVPWMNANSTYAITQAINVCNSLAPNVSYDFYYWIDYNNSVSESDENDNVYNSLSYFVNCTPPAPNLFIASDNSFLNGNQITFNFSIGNNGNSNANGFWVDYLAIDAVMGNLYYLGTGNYIPNLSAGNTWSGYRIFDFCTLGLPNGNYDVGYVIDYVSGNAVGNIIESNENDNELAIAYSYPFSCSVVNYPVTFQVDMSQTIVNTNGVHIAGDFQSEAGFAWDWDPGITQLLDPDLDGIYSITVYLPAGNYQYKFVNGNVWGAEETVPIPCNVGGNRGMQNNVGLTLPPVCFGDCYACINTYTITTSPNPSNGGTTAGGGTYLSGQNVTLSAIPQTGWQFVDWQENGATVSTNSQYSFTVSGNRSLVANFTQIYHWISIVAVPVNGGTTTWSGSQPFGQTMTVTATPQTGWQFVDWQENGATVSTNSQYSFTVTGDRNLVANFTQTTYTITTSQNPSNGGTTAGGGTYLSGQNVTLSAIPQTGWQFVDWQENGATVSTNSQYSFTISGNRSLVANFTQTTYTVTTSQNPSNGGSTTGGGAYLSGQNVTLSATPQTGWQFVDWQENGATVSTNSQYSFTISGNRSLVANFTQIYHWIYIIAVPANGGTTTWSGSQPFGQTMTVTATPQTGWQFVDWQENGATVSTNSQYSFTVTGDRNLVANFTQLNQTYAINGIPNPSNAGIVYGSGNYIGGGNANLIATANGGWLFLNWSDGSTIVSTNTNYSFVVTSTKTLVANFIPIVGIEQQNGVSGILIYPNPSKGIFTIEWQKLPANTTNIEVINNLGQIVYYGKSMAGQQSLTIDLQNVAKGIYLMRIGNDTVKLMID